MELSVVDTKSSVQVSDIVFSQDFNQGLIHEVVTAYYAGGRAGTKAQKNRSDVRGGGKKPWKQKGTGRARAGTSRGPIWTGGGVTFAARPRDYTKKVNKKAYRAAMRSIISELLRQDRLLVVESLPITEPKTKQAIAFLKKMGCEDQKVLIVVPEDNPAIELAVRNIPYLAVCRDITIDPASLVMADKVVITVAALQHLEERLK